MSLPVAPKPSPRRFHQARWDEPIIFELHAAGERGMIVSPVEPGVRAVVGDVVADLPDAVRRTAAPALPEIGQMRVLKHFLRLSQETLGSDLNVDIGQGTCTIKYSPKINDQLLDAPQLRDVHPGSEPCRRPGRPRDDLASRAADRGALRAWMPSRCRRRAVRPASGRTSR